MQTILKQLNTQKSETKQQIAALDSQIKSLDNTRRKKRDELALIENKIQQATRNITVSEHAILRYLERIKHVDIEATKAEILQPDTRNQIQTLGNGDYPSNGFKIRVRDHVVVTIIDHDKEPKNES